MKYYTVFKGYNPGVYDNWDDAREQVEGFNGAVYKSYSTAEEAAEAFRRSDAKAELAQLANILLQSGSRKNESANNSWRGNPEIDPDAWAVDASCLGNPGKMEYRGVELSTGREIFRVGPFEDATNNIGEFLAIVHAMALMTKQGSFHNIYSDSVSGMAWARNRLVKTRLTPTDRNKKVFELMARATVWLRSHNFPAKVLKWDTERWGEIPADFGRK